MSLFFNLQVSIETGLFALAKVFFTELIFIHFRCMPATQRHSRIPPVTSNVSPEFEHGAFSAGVDV
jgi:hypothetical protein